MFTGSPLYVILQPDTLAQLTVKTNENLYDESISELLPEYIDDAHIYLPKMTKNCF